MQEDGSQLRDLFYSTTLWHPSPAVSAQELFFFVIVAPLILFCFCLWILFRHIPYSLLQTLWQYADSFLQQQSKHIHMLSQAIFCCPNSLLMQRMASLWQISLPLLALHHSSLIMNVLLFHPCLLLFCPLLPAFSLDHQSHLNALMIYGPDLLLHLLPTVTLPIVKINIILSSLQQAAAKFQCRKWSWTMCPESS